MHRAGCSSYESSHQRFCSPSAYHSSRHRPNNRPASNLENASPWHKWGCRWRRKKHSLWSLCSPGKRSWSNDCVFSCGGRRGRAWWSKLERWIYRWDSVGRGGLGEPRCFRDGQRRGRATARLYSRLGRRSSKFWLWEGTCCGPYTWWILRFDPELGGCGVGFGDGVDHGPNKRDEYRGVFRGCASKAMHCVCALCLWTRRMVNEAFSGVQQHAWKADGARTWSYDG